MSREHRHDDWIDFFLASIDIPAEEGLQTPGEASSVKGRIQIVRVVDIRRAEPVWPSQLDQSGGCVIVEQGLAQRFLII